MTATIGFVVIGRNEGERLIACLRSLNETGGGLIVYVDSGSTDDSIENAIALSAEIVRLDMRKPFTAARARNAGARRHIELGAPVYIQFIDGDCTLAAGWLKAAAEYLDTHPEFAVVCGRRREQRPDASIYNRLCDLEWATPVGEAIACGGDALMRTDAIASVGFYDETLIAGEEPELCLRLREKGWRISRIAAEMTQHDAAISRFSQWWKRAKRAGHAFAEVSDIHRASPKRIWALETRRALLWSMIAPVAVLLAMASSPFWLLALLAYPAQAFRLWRSARPALGLDAAPYAALSVLGKFAEAEGVISYLINRLRRRRSRLIEYK